MWRSLTTGLKVIPWDKIPWRVLIGKLDEILGDVRQAPPTEHPTLNHLATKLKVIDEDLKLSAEVAKKLTQEIAALASAKEILASRIVWALILSGLSLFLSLITLGRAFFH